MTEAFPDSPRDENDGASSLSGDEKVQDQVQALTWALLDERISENEIVQLNQLLLGSGKARDTYIRCVQLHSDLQAQFAESQTLGGVASPVKPPVLGFLQSGIFPLDVQMPRAEDTTS
jgi:hypothetical protein